LTANSGKKNFIFRNRIKSCVKLRGGKYQALVVYSIPDSVISLADILEEKAY